jgi:two-component system, OmpR family, phosphate regulon sensor histidine kinase PhoR
MPDLVLVLMVALGLSALWLGWRYISLRKALVRYEEWLRSPRRTEGPSAPELEAVSRIVRQLLTEGDQEIERITAERDRLAAGLDQLADGVLIANPIGEVQYANPAAVRILQIPNPLEKTVTEVLRDHRLVEAWRLSVKSGGMHSESVELPTRHQFIQLVVVPDTHGGGSLLLAQDLTRVRRLETVRQDFVSNFSHELRTPLASLRALAETLLEGALRDPEAAPRFLQRMIGEVDSLTQMSQELLDLTAIESGKAALQLAAVDPLTLLDSAAERMRMQTERAGLTLEVDCPEALPSIRADATRLGQVLLNLIHNAVKFTPPGGKIVLSARASEPPKNSSAPSPGLVQFSVSDSGHGISPNDLPRIFERFYRADRARATGGTGMGLSIARHLIEAHGGRIWAESIAGQGSTFHFSIPQVS